MHEEQKNEKLPFYILLDHNEEVEHEGVTVRRYLVYRGYRHLHFSLSLVSTNSTHAQAVIIEFNRRFKGNITLNGKEYKLPKGRFPSFIFRAEYMTSPIEVDIEVKDGLPTEAGDILLCNGSEDEDKIDGEIWYHSCSWGCAMIVEQIGENEYLAKCNDHDKDDDFDDLIFKFKVELS